MKCAAVLFEFRISFALVLCGFQRSCFEDARGMTVVNERAHRQSED